MGKNVKPLISSVAATVKRASTYVFAERLIRNAEVRGSTPELHHLIPTIYGCRHWRSYFIRGQFVDTFPSAQFDRLNGHSPAIWTKNLVAHDR